MIQLLQGEEKMNITTLIEELKQFNEDEILYKKYYDYQQAGKTNWKSAADDMGVSYAFFKTKLIII